MTVSSTALTAVQGREPAAMLPMGAQAPRPVEPQRISADQQAEKQAIGATPAQAGAAVDEVNKSLQMASIGVRFEFDKDAHTMVTRVMDTQTGEVIRQMPNEEAVRISKVLGNMQGLLVSQKV